MLFPEPEGRRDPISVVVVDDQLLVATAVSGLLDDTVGIRVVAVSGTAAGGLAEVRQHQPDVLLLDQHLPDGLGTDLVPQVAQVSPGTKVVLLTASGTDDVLRRALASGCVGVCQKDISAPGLIDAVGRAAAGGTVFSPAELRRLAAPVAARRGDDLTARELEVLALLVEGRSTDAISRELFLSAATVRNHVQAVIGKLGAHSKLEAVAVAVREGIVQPPR